jgi:type IV pilus assembly protein PilM
MFKTKKLIAIDIGSSSIKVVQISGYPNKTSMANFAMDLLPEGSIVNGIVVDGLAITQVLKKIISELKLKGRRASISVSGSGVMLKKIRVPSSANATVSEQVQQQAAESFQLDLAEMYFDYVEMGRDQESVDSVDVLLVGARREVIEQYVSIVKGAGLEIGAMEASAISVANMFEANYGAMDDLVALVSIGASHLQVGFVERGRFLYSQEMPIGGDQYTNLIMQSMNVKREVAEQIKIAASTNPAAITPELQKIIDEVNTLISNDIRQCFAFFQSSPEGSQVGPIKYCFLTGGASRTLNLDSVIAAAIQVPVHFANPFQRIQITAKNFQTEQIAAIGSMVSCAVGLGLRLMDDKVAV